MAIQFGSLNKVNRTYTREGGAVRKQDYTGLKFRRAITEATQKDATAAGQAPIAEEQFYASNALFAKLQLDEQHGFIQYDRPDGSGVMLILVDATHDDCKIFKDNARGKKKSKMFYAPILAETLVKVGVIDPTFLGNQFLQLVEATDVTDLPTWVKGIYDVVKDATVAAKEQGADEEGEEEEIAETAAKVEAGNDF